MKQALTAIFYGNLLLLLMTSGCTKVESRYEVGVLSPTPTASEIPENWKSIETDRFTLSLPPEMKEKKVKGIDTQVWQYKSEDISLSIEAGVYVADFSFERERYESKVEKVTVNGIDAERTNLDLNKPRMNSWAFNADGSTKVPTVRQNDFVGLYFRSKETSFSIRRAPEVPLSKVDVILNSIRFKD